MASTHLFHLPSSQQQQTRNGGRRIDVNVQNLPVLSGIALSYLEITPKGFREPHWHPNANELSYCLQGQAMMTIFSPGAGHDTFTIRAGEIVFVPMGYLHHIENIGEEPARFLVCFNHELPEDLNLSSALGVMPNHVLADTFKLTASFFANLHKEVNPVFIAQQAQEQKPPLPYMMDQYKLDFGSVNPQIKNAGGWVKMSNAFLLPTLQGLAVYDLVLAEKGVREPHWHPNAAELNYLISGTARITLLSPSGSVDTFDMQAGDLSFMPRGYFHHIENTGTEPAHFTVFFNHQFPSDIGLSGCLGAYSNNILGPLYGVDPSYFDKLPKYQHDLLIVAGGG